MKNIISVSDGTKTYSAFLSGGHDELEYFFYVEVGNGAYRLESMNAYRVYVYEDSEKPYLRTRPNTCGYRWELHVPENSIKRGVVLDIGGKI